MQQLTHKDLPTLTTAARVCQEVLSHMPSEEIKQHRLGGLYEVLEAVLGKVTEARRAIRQARQSGAPSGTLVLAFSPTEWWAVWHALNCMYRLLDEDSPIVEALSAPMAERRRQQLRSLLAVVHAVLHHPTMPLRCTCQDGQDGPDKTQKAKPNDDSYRWN